MQNRKYIRFVLISFFLLAAAQGRFSLVHAATDITINDGGTYTVDNTDTSRNIVISTVAGGTIHAETDLTWSGNATINVAGVFNVDSEKIFTLNGNLAGSGTFTKTGAGTFLYKGNSAPSGTVYIDDGMFSYNGTSALTGTVEVTDTGTFSYNGTSALSATVNISDDGIFEYNGDADLTGTVGINDNGTFLYNGNSALTGTVNIGGGTFIYYGADTQVGTVNVISGTLDGSGTGALGIVNIKSGAFLVPGTSSDSFGSMTIDKLTLESGSTLKIRADADGHSDQVEITNSLIVENDANVVFDAPAGDYGSGKYYYPFLFNGGAATYGTFNHSVEQKFLLSEWDDVNERFRIYRDPLYFGNHAITRNQHEVAQGLYHSFSNEMWDVMIKFSDWIESGGDPNDIRAAYDEMLPGLKANSMMLGQWQTSRYGLNHLDLTNCGVSQGNGVWLEFIHQTTNFDGDANNNDYGISRTGFIVGSEERRVDVTYGFFVGYSLPYLYDHGNKVKVNDLQFGFYGGSKVNDILETKLFVGYGHQGYKSTRYLHSPLLVQQGEDNRIEGDYSGDSMSMSLEFAVPIQSGFFSLRPLFAIDSDLTWQYGFAETGTTGVELWYDRGFLNRSFLRTGLTAQLGSVGDCDPIALTGRFYYGYQAFGDSYPMARSKFATETTSHRMEAYGVDTGKSYVDLGVGLRWNIDSNRSFYGDYDFTAFSNSTAHWGSLGYMQKW